MRVAAAALMFFAASTVFAQDFDATSAQERVETILKGAVGRDAPGILSIDPDSHAWPGHFEIVLDSEQVIYFDPETERVFVGVVLDEEGTNLTAQTLNALRVARIKSIEPHVGMIIGQGEPLFTAIVNLSEPHSKQFVLSTSLPYRLLFKSHPERYPLSTAQALDVLCSQTPQRRIKDIARDEVPASGYKRCDQGIRAFGLHQIALKAFNVRVTPTFIIAPHTVIEGGQLEALNNVVGK